MMVSSEPSPSSFRQRFVWALWEDTGVAVDLRTGTYSLLNPTASAICRLIEEVTSWEQALRMVATKWQLDDREAQAALKSVVEALREEQRAPVWDAEVAFHETNNGLVLSDGGCSVLEIDATRRTIRRCAPESGVRLSIEHYLRLFSGKLLPLLDVPVLHAATCRTSRGLLAFCGASGSGKSTTARLMGNHGASRVSDDLLVLSVDEAGVRAHPEAEARIFDWCRQVGECLQVDPLGAVPYDSILNAAKAPGEPLSNILFLSSERRKGTSIHAIPLSLRESLAEVMAVSFLDGRAPERLQAFLGMCRQISVAVKAELGWMPSGVEALDAALPTYIAKVTS